MKINAENKELILKNSFGDRIIIPASDREKVQGMIDSKCYGCIDAYASKLPSYRDYAEDGSIYPREGVVAPVSTGTSPQQAQQMSPEQLRPEYVPPIIIDPLSTEGQDLELDDQPKQQGGGQVVDTSEFNAPLAKTGTSAVQRVQKEINSRLEDREDILEDGIWGKVTQVAHDDYIKTVPKDSTPLGVWEGIDENAFKNTEYNSTKLKSGTNAVRNYQRMLNERMKPEMEIEEDGVWGEETQTLYEEYVGSLTQKGPKVGELKK